MNRIAYALVLVLFPLNLLSMQEQGTALPPVFFKTYGPNGNALNIDIIPNISEKDSLADAIRQYQEYYKGYYNVDGGNFTVHLSGRIRNYPSSKWQQTIFYKMGGDKPGLVHGDNWLTTVTAENPIEIYLKR